MYISGFIIGLQIFIKYLRYLLLVFLLGKVLESNIQPQGFKGNFFKEVTKLGTSRNQHVVDLLL